MPYFPYLSSAGGAQEAPVIRDGPSPETHPLLDQGVHGHVLVKPVSLRSGSGHHASSDDPIGVCRTWMW